VSESKQSLELLWMLWQETLTGIKAWSPVHGQPFNLLSCFVDLCIVTCQTQTTLMYVSQVAMIRWSLSPRHGASSGCRWWNGLQYGG